jgi:hypothetical protein
MGKLRLAFLILLGMCVSCVSPTLPQWVEGESPKYPSAGYLTAVGIAKDRRTAENAAIAGIGRIFQARVNSVSQDMIKSLSKFTDFTKEIVSEETFTRNTEISTQVVLTGVNISEVAERSGEVFVLATLDKVAAKNRLQQNISKLEEETRALFLAYTHASTKIEKIRKLKVLIDKNMERGRLAAELNIVSQVGIIPTGGKEPWMNLGKLVNEMEDLRFRNFRIVVKMEGEGVLEFRNSVEEALTALSFVVTKDETAIADLLVHGKVSISPLDHPDKSWKWVQYTCDLFLIDPTQGKTLRTIPNLRGQVAQLTEDAARFKAIQTVKEKIKVAVSSELNSYIYGS